MLANFNTHVPFKYSLISQGLMQHVKDKPQRS